MGTWFWLNVPLGVLIFSAVSGIPLWLVLRHPDTGPTATAPDAAIVDAAPAARARGHRGSAAPRRHVHNAASEPSWQQPAAGAREPELAGQRK